MKTVRGFSKGYWIWAQLYINDVCAGRRRPKLRLEEEITERHCFMTL